MGSAEAAGEEEDPAWLPLGEALRLGLEGEVQGVEIAAAVEEALNLPRVQVARAVAWESGRVELAEDVMAALGGPVLPVVAAVRAEMGKVPDLGRAVVEELGAKPLPVGQAVRAEAGMVEIAGAVGVALGQPGVFEQVRTAIHAEAGRVDLVGAVLQAIGGQAPLPVAEAVREEAGPIQVVERVERTLAPEVMAGVLDHQLDDCTHRLAAQHIREDNQAADLTSMAELGRELVNAIHREAGPVDLWAEVAHAIGIQDPEHVEGWDGRLLAQAVQAEAGPVDPSLLPSILEGVRRYAQGGGMPRAEAPIDALPLPANRGTWALGGLLMAAIVLMMVGLGRLGAGPAGLEAPMQGLQVVSAMTFAMADELVVEDLQYGADVQVFQTQGEEGAVIIWVDEEAVL